MSDTHTHTHTYIYIYIYILRTCKLTYKKCNPLDLTAKLTRHSSYNKVTCWIEVE